MHEMGIAKDLIEAVRKELSGKKETGRVMKIYVRLGENTIETRQSLMFWFENLSQGTELEGAILDFSPGVGNSIVVDSVEVE